MTPTQAAEILAKHNEWRRDDITDTTTMADPTELGKAIDVAVQVLRRLDAEAVALRKGAERYRWLRDEAWGGNNKRGPHLVEFKPGHTPSFFTELAEQAADAAIDAAMKDQT